MLISPLRYDPDARLATLGLREPIILLQEVYGPEA
jgi:hypothetical protein